MKTALQKRKTAMDKSAILLASVLCGIWLSASPPGLGATNELHRLHGRWAEFTIDLPADWKETNSPAFAAMVDPYPETEEPSPGRQVRYGYCPGASETLTNPPCLLVEIYHRGRLPDRLMALQSKGDFLRLTISENLKKAGILERNILETDYDTNRFMVRFGYTKVQRFPRKEFRIAQSVFFTEKGFVNFMAVCPKQDWALWTNTFDRAIASVQIAHGLRYRLYAPPKPPSGTMVKEFLTGIGMVLAAGIFYIIYQRRKNSVMSDEI